MLTTKLDEPRNVHKFQRNQVTEKGRPRCRFDMMIRWPKHAKRMYSNPFTERGDRYEKDSLGKMLKYLVSYFVNKHDKEEWELVELYDNTKPPDDPERLVLRYKDGALEHNRLRNYLQMFDEINYRLPEWLL